MSKSTRFSSEIIPGVYKIENTLNGNVYVGSSKDIYGRWVQHKRDLRKQQHHCVYLQRVWNKYGEKNFTFETLEITTSNNKMELFNCEQKWYNYYFDADVCLYNTSSVVMMPNGFTTIDDLKNGRRKITYDQFENVCWYLSNTRLPITKISEITKVSDRSIYEIYFRKHYTELTKDMNFISRTVLDASQDYHAKLSKSEVLEIIEALKIGACVSDLADKYGIAKSTIFDIYHQRTWKNLSEGVRFAPLIESSKRTNKPVIQYDLNMNYIAEYESSREAEKVTGIGYKMISRVCNYKRPHTHGFIFRFKNDTTIQN